MLGVREEGREWEKGFAKGHDETRGGDGYILFVDCGDIPWLGLPDLASKNIGCPIKLNFG